MKHWTSSEITAQGGRSFLITGPGGLGFETSLTLAKAGGEVILAGRDEAKGQAALDRIRVNEPLADVSFELLDLADLASIHAMVDRLAGKRRALDVLINNAGVMAPPQRRSTADRFELQFGTNHLGHFALTGLLLPMLRAGDAPRVVTVSSLAHKNGRIDFDDLQAQRHYRPFGSYSQSKLANLMFAIELQRRSEVYAWGIASFAAHPGTSDTNLIANGTGKDSMLHRAAELIGSFTLQPAAQGALPSLFAATSPQAVPGGYYGPDGFFEMKGWPAPAAISARARDGDVAARLWEVSEKLTAVPFG
jgi:NAD(P)-dependent dehydrogenase (short-subunit alcohol dehydrogenase family)